MHRIKFLMLSVFITIQYLSLAQELPPIKNFSTKDYGAENQNWNISQAENKFMYVANNKGLLEFNGANWQLYSTPNETIMRSVKAFKNKVFTGFYMDFGYWVKNNVGVLEYTSIVKEKNIQLIEDEQIWEIVELDGWMIFKSLQRIYLYHLSTKSVKTIESEGRIEKITKIDETLYFQEINKGVFQLENGVPKLISDDPILKKNILVGVFKKDGNLLFLTQEKGFYFIQDNKIKKWNIPANKHILTKKIYSGKRLRNNDFVLGTVSNGLYYVKNDGTLKYQINQSSGLGNNTVLSIFEDIDDNVWLGLDDGISYINITSPFRIFKDQTNFWGTIYTSALYKGMLYLGTNQGVFYKKYGTNDFFKFINKTKGQAWSLVEIDGELFCGHDSGTFLINEGIVAKIANTQGTWGVKKLKENKLLQGCYDGLYVLEKTKGEWRVRNKVSGFLNSSRYFEILDANSIFVNHEYKNIFKLTVDNDFRQIIKIEKEFGVNKGTHSSIVKHQNNIFYANKNGVFKYDKINNKFKSDSIYSKLISEEDFTSGKLIYDKDNNKLWSFSKHNIRFLTPGKLSNSPKVKRVSISETLRKGASGFENIIHLKNKKYLIGASKGYITIDLNYISNPKDFNISINKVSNFVQGEAKKEIDLKEENVFKYEENNIEFSFGIPNFDKITTTKYQFYLEGQGKQWSVPSYSNSMLFKSISYGDYIFKVRGIIGEKISKNIATYAFKIKRPWYLSNLLIVFYVLLFLFTLYLLHISSKRYYKKQREEFLEKVQKESELKELESSKEIMKLNNEKLRNDIDAKNRELATSTMNIIKKNEFLNSIKNELIKDGESNLTKVIKIINTNLNNTDDWKMFQEAFNNADKKFLKKMKSRHSDLTPNDLRLCAYLRLNLSSKEIAPLLNISPRSVEVKRYRLRKKMNLSHDLNLTTYILEI